MKSKTKPDEEEATLIAKRDWELLPENEKIYYKNMAIMRNHRNR
jgi:hypothetical protein